MMENEIDEYLKEIRPDLRASEKTRKKELSGQLAKANQTGHLSVILQLPTVNTVELRVPGKNVQSPIHLAHVECAPDITQEQIDSIHEADFIFLRNKITAAAIAEIIPDYLHKYYQDYPNIREVNFYASINDYFKKMNALTIQVKQEKAA